MHLALPSFARETPVSNEMQPLTLQTTPTGEVSAVRAGPGVSDPQPSATFGDEANNLADDSDFDEATSMLNTIEDLKKGIVQTKDKSRSEYTILLVGETGTGKSALLAFIANVLAGNSLFKYDFTILDPDNERGVSQKENQTKYAKLYEFTSQNGIKINVLDTPGLADTRGIQQDELHKKGIATEIKEQVTAVDAVLILANGTLPRLSVSTEYALTTLSSIFPKSLADNISLVLTMCPSPLSINFTDDAVPPSLRKAPQLYIDNPLSLLPKYREMKAKGQYKRQLHAVRDQVVASETAALQTMVRFFDWLDDLNPQPTMDILTLFNKLQTIQQKINDILSQMTQAQDKSEEIRRLTCQIELGQAKDEAAREAMRQALADADRVVEINMVILADLAEEYGKMSLSGSFSAHLERGIDLLEMHLASSRESNTDSGQQKRLEENAAELKHKLDVLKEANSRKQKAKNRGQKGWNMIKWTAGAAGPTAAPAAGK
ncbi:hypothetical protein C8R44DRAFT_740427 [Mycena epipterygia]|nr:hypothetical protein C8R44DRAFT_740427 [Mycena epipterygia]